ncbi:glycoside hydrolase family 2 [bacterium]|nr:MAG: glycoside hydrolase family 2 [bacterium]
MTNRILGGFTLTVAASLACGPVNFAQAAPAWTPAPGPLQTRWTKEVSPTNALTEYPRPQLVRKNWVNLNGLWDYSLSPATQDSAPTGKSGQILVPFPYESQLSGVGKPSIPNQKLWYKRSFTVPASWKGQKVNLHFGAVTHEAEVWVNGKKVGSHVGSYNGFSFDVTSALKAGKNEIIVAALNPLKDESQVLGKQRLSSGGIFYTGASGIWQTVWLEPVPNANIKALKMTPDIDRQVLNLTVDSSYPKLVKITALDGNKVIATVTGSSNKGFTIPVKSPKLWTPETPTLYRLKVELLNKATDKTPVDSVNSYFAMRKISLGKEKGLTKIFLNNKFVFQVGALDQGYWPDGLYTAPTDAALKYDIEVAKKLGFNLLRKHAKVEPERWYYHADKLGMLVWQDMPQMFGGERDWTPAVKAQWEKEWREEIKQFHNFPSIIVWTPFNEGWGQHDTEAITALTKQLDPSRLVNSASGWTDKGVGDIADAHDYRGPGAPNPSETRAAVCGEFGGLSLPYKGRRWDESVGIMGYGATIRHPWELTRLYQDLMRKAFDLRDNKGTSAVVYTQIVDVEQEVNGLVTYDRDIIKPTLGIAVAANNGKFPSLPPNPYPNDVVVVPNAQDGWSFTTQAPSADWFQPGFDASSWKVGPAPFGNDLGGMRTNWNTSDIWIRREITLPENLPAKLSFSVIHDEDAQIYINGVLAASLKEYNTGYEWVDINAAGRAAMKPGKNVIAVHVSQTRGGQGVDVGIGSPAQYTY